jgi:hypothetical protein
MMSTIDRAQPAFHSPLSTAPVRDNFNAAANDIDALSSAAPVIVSKQADQSVATTILTLDTELTHTLLPLTRYAVSVFVRWNSPGAGGIKYGLTTTGGDLHWSDPSALPGSEFPSGDTVNTSASGSFQATPIGVITTSGTSAVLSFQFALNASDAQPVTVRAGSWMMVIRADPI